MPNAQCPMPYALCPMPYALCPIPYAQFPMPYTPCPMPDSQFPIPNLFNCSNSSSVLQFDNITASRSPQTEVLLQFDSTILETIARHAQ